VASKYIRMALRAAAALLVLPSTVSSTHAASVQDPPGHAIPQGRIVFSSDRDGGVVELWSMNPDGSGVVQLTHHGADMQDWWPVFSPDGAHIAFTRYLSTGTPGDFSEALYLMNPDGTHLQLLSNMGNNVDDNLAEFSPNGREIAFASDRNDPNRLTNGCRFSIGGPGCNWDIFVMRLDGTHLRQLTNDPGADTYPEFSPDGGRIMFTSTRSGSSEIYTMNRDGKNVQKLTRTPCRRATPTGRPTESGSPSSTTSAPAPSLRMCS
jgi:TolB protein